MCNIYFGKIGFGADDCHCSNAGQIHTFPSSGSDIPGHQGITARGGQFACHYNGELTTTGRDALMAWNVTSGRWKGMDLAGVRAMAIVSSEANLAEVNIAHRSEVLIDSAASEAQATALVDALKTKYAASLGSITSVRRTPIEFNHEGATFTASAEKLASIDVDAMPNDECCKMPNLVWYSPLAPLLNRKVGYTQKVQYAGGSVGES